MDPVDLIVGTGGIGTGKIYQLEGNESLGRNETRFGHLQNRKDYCKLHIVFHYIAVLLRDFAPGITVLPVGGVGNDAEGVELFRQMSEVGMNTEHIKITPGIPTLTALCYQFPDGSGGNITERESASLQVTPSDIEKACSRLKDKRVITAALPEVPFETRIHLIRTGMKQGAVNAASFVSAEMEQLRDSNIIPGIDILSLNVDEAASLASYDGSGTEETAQRCFQYVSGKNSQVKCIVTAGKEGFYAFYRGEVAHFLPHEVKLRNSAGAGDALLAGVIIGEALGLPFFGSSGPTTLRLANCLAAQSVEAPDTINFQISAESFQAFCRAHGYPE